MLTKRKCSSILKTISELSFGKRNQFLKESGLAKLGAGTSRSVYSFLHNGREVALKVAKNKKGLAQNYEELQYLIRPEVQDTKVVIPYVDHDTLNTMPVWIITERANKISSYELWSNMGCSLESFVHVCEKLNIGEDLRSEYVLQAYHATPLLDGFCQLLNTCDDLMSGDLERIRNWGMYDGRPVILDLGFNSFTEHLYSGHLYS